MRSARHIRATYRLQLHEAFTFADAARLVPQLAELGISHLYLSPALEAVPGSTHGYDVVDPTRIRRALGGEPGLRELAATAHRHGLGLVLDIVPNHVGLVSPANPWWWDVLAHGPDATYADHFDIAWRRGAHGQSVLLLPELGSPLADELAAGTLTLDHHPEGSRPGWRVCYHDHAWPLAPGSLTAEGLDESDVTGTRARLAGDAGRLAALLARQHYELADWRRANDELDHRRFFDVSSLGALRVEDAAVFADVHAAVLPLVADGTLDGLRIDHPDGLADPVGYLHRLRSAVGDDVWIVVEKILSPGERFRDDWPVDGTVGYEFAALALGVHVAATGDVFDALQATLTGSGIDREELHDRAKRTALDRLFGAERRRLAAALDDAAPDLHDATDTLTELLVAWPAYRTYVRAEDGAAGPEDLAVIGTAVARVRARRPELGATLERIAALLRLEVAGDATHRFVRLFQQLTGPAVAKGVEDTVLYRDLRFVAVNEVGSDPGVLGRHVGELHAVNADTQRNRPATLLLTSSHDTKRSLDVRARLAVISQDPDHWVASVLHLRALAARHVGSRGPTPAHQHLALQTAVGAWPIDVERLASYLVKAAREGKDATDWLEPDEGYEADLRHYAQALVEDPALHAALEATLAPIREPGWLTSLSMTLVTLLSPGVPDTYQGGELWDHSLVDPDNRRPVDHARRAALLAELRDGVEPAALLDRLAEGLPKMWVLRQALRLRQDHPGAFDADASYEPLAARGRWADNVVAFLRGGRVLTVAPVQVRRLGTRFADWDLTGTTLPLPPGTWSDVLSGAHHHGGEQPLGDLLGRFPVAALVRADHPGTGR